MELCNGCVNHVLISRALMQASVSKSMAYLHALTPFFTFHSSPLSGVSHLERTYIIWPSTDMLGVRIYYMAISWHAGSGGAYMSADMLGVRIYYMVFGWHACSGGAYISADTLGARIYYMIVGWHACSGAAYMSADTLGACIGAHICRLTRLEHAYI